MFQTVLYKDYQNEVKECKRFIVYIRVLLAKIIEEKHYYKDEIKSLDYNDEDLEAIIRGVYNETELNLIKKYIVSYDKNLINESPINLLIYYLKEPTCPFNCNSCVACTHITKYINGFIDRMFMTFCVPTKSTYSENKNIYYGSWIHQMYLSLEE